jgi:hypothetical protein
VGGWAQAQPDGWTDPKKHTVNLAPYIKKTRDGRITKFWAEDRQPDMIMKVAETQLLRQVWGEESTGMYTPEEMPSLEDIQSGPLETTAMQSDTVKRLKPETVEKATTAPEPDKVPEPSTDKTAAARVDRYFAEGNAEAPAEATEPERKRATTGQFKKKAETEPPEPPAAPEEQVEPATDGIPPEWERKVWFKKRTSGFTTHVWTHLKTMPDILEGEVRQKWFKLHGQQVPFPKDAPKPPDEGQPAPVEVPPEANGTTVPADEAPITAFHDVEDFDDISAKVQEVYLEIAKLNGCDIVEVDPKHVNAALKSRYNKAHEAARVQLDFGMIATSTAAADVWNNAIGVMLDGGNF